MAHVVRYSLLVSKAGGVLHVSRNFTTGDEKT